ncbi:hypothetical protein [Streptomyces violaceusniger]|uniref:hypothetical protein n=1 Tax=Streptomyces violaceusniger TaxID=68280 RepID=UPI00382154AB
MPKNQPTAAKKARAVQRAHGGKHTALLAEQTCGQSLDPFGEYSDTCARAPHPDSEPHSGDRHFDLTAWKERATTEEAAAQARWDALTHDERAESERRQFEEDYDDGRTTSDDWEDTRSSKWED